MGDFFRDPVFKEILFPCLLLLFALFLMHVAFRNSRKQIRLEKAVRKEVLLLKKKNDYDTLLRVEKVIKELFDFFEQFYSLKILDLYSSNELTDKYQLIAKKDIQPWFNLRQAVIGYRRGKMVIDELLRYLP